jgi:hypothetical protein
VRDEVREDSKRQIGMWRKRVEYSLERFIFVGLKPLPEEEWTRLCERYGEYQKRVPAGDALLVDLRGDQPTLIAVPLDYEPSEVRKEGLAGTSLR